jgi:probable F420-dependent oxidoreductase
MSGTKRAFRFGTGAFPIDSRKALVDVARKVESLGYNTLLIPDHFEEGLLNPFLAMLVMAEATNILRFGTYVIDNDFRHPAILAKEAATFDILSDGRLELGIGAGWKREDYEMTGLQFDSPSVRVDRAIESVQIIKRLFTEKTVSFAGTHYTVTELVAWPHPVQRPHPPILIGAGSKKLLSTGGREADIVGLVPRARGGTLDFGDASHTATERKIAWVREAAGERFDAIEINTLVFGCVVTDRREEAAAQLAAGWGMAPEDVLNSVHFLVGTVPQMVEEVQQWRETFGISYITVFPNLMDVFAPVVAQLAGK